jgi:hypothetical protein
VAEVEMSPQDALGFQHYVASRHGLRVPFFKVQGAGCRVQGLRLLTHDVFHYVGRGVPCDVLPKWMILPVFHHVGRGVPGAVLQTIEAVTPLAASYQGIPKLLLLLQGLGFRF